MPSSSAELSNLAQESVWLDKQRYEDAESNYIQGQAKPEGASQPGSGAQQRVDQLAAENKKLLKVTEDLIARITKLENRVASLEKSGGNSGSPAQAKEPKQRTTSKSSTGTPAAKKVEEPIDDDDVDLFGSDNDDNAEQEKLKQARVQAYQEKKSKKPALIAKSNVILDVKPWDDETDMKEMERLVRAIVMDGLIWGASKLAPLAYGIHKLQISCVVEDDKVSVDELQEKIQENEDFVQSVDIAAFNKV